MCRTSSSTLLTYLFSEVLDGRNAHLADGVQRALGREPRDFSDYAREAAATGVWNAAGQRLRAVAERAERGRGTPKGGGILTTR